MKDTNSLSHTSYRCKYHIVIVPKYRIMIIYNKLRRDIAVSYTHLVGNNHDKQNMIERTGSFPNVPFAYVTAPYNRFRSIIFCLS